MVLRNFEGHVSARSALKNAKEVAAGKGNRGLFLYGKPGRGKTHLAVGILQDRLSRNLPGIYVTMVDLMRQLKDFDKGKPSELLELVKNTQFLLLDDMGAELGSHYELVRLFEIINHRMNGMKSMENPEGFVTVITSNYSPAELAKKRMKCCWQRIFYLVWSGRDWSGRARRRGR